MRKTDQPSANPSREEAERIAIAALGFVASDEELLPRFLAMSGIEASQIRRAAGEPGFMAGLLRFIVAHEPTLVAFASHAGIPPQSVQQALNALPHGDDSFETST